MIRLRRKLIRIAGILPLAAMVLVLVGCAGKMSPQETVSEHESYYLNANLDFALEHPQNWKRLKWGEKEATGDQYTVEWTSPSTPEHPAMARASVTALPPALVRGGYEGMLEMFQDERHGFVLTDRREGELPAGPVRQILGHTSQRTFLVFFLTSYRRAFTLVFSSPPEYFDQFRPTFLKMAESLRILD